LFIPPSIKTPQDDCTKLVEPAIIAESKELTILPHSPPRIAELQLKVILDIQVAIIEDSDEFLIIEHSEDSIDEKVDESIQLPLPVETREC